MVLSVDKRKKDKHNNVYYNLRDNIYNKRIKDKFTDQFKQIHDVDYSFPALNKTPLSDEEGLNRAYDSPNRFYHYRNKLFIAGNIDPVDFYDDLKLPMDNTLKLTKRGRDVEAYYKNHMAEIDTIIGHSEGGSVSLALEDKYRHDKIDLPGIGIKQVKTFSAPVVAGNIGGNNQFIKNKVVEGTENLGSKVGSEIGGAIGYGIDALTGFEDLGMFTAGFTRAGTKVGTKVGNTVGTRLTTRPENNPDRIRYFGDPISALDFNAKTVMPSLKFRWGNSAHTYKGLSIPDKVEEHDTISTPLSIQPSDDQAQIINK